LVRLWKEKLNELSLFDLIYLTENFDNRSELEIMSKFLRMVVFIVGICMLALFKPAFGLSRPSTIVLKNNGFTNVVVAIHESVPEDKTLIDTLKVIYISFFSSNWFTHGKIYDFGFV
jgi:hypothetical protein